MVSVTIGSATYEAYANQTTADTFLAADLRLNPIWTLLSADDKGRALVTATRVLDRQDWLGEPTNPGTQPLAWPRTGVTDEDGNTIDSATIPQAVIDASVFLAALVADNPALAEAENTGSNVEEVQADTVRVRFFRPQAGQRFPIMLHELIGPFLESSAGGIAGARSFGTDQESTTPSSGSFGTDFGFSEGLS